MQEMEKERFLFGRLFCLQASLCKIEPQNRETASQCVESLKSFFKLLQHVNATTPDDFNEGITAMMEHIHRRISELTGNRCAKNGSPQEEESQDQGDDDDYKMEYYVTAREECIHCEGTGISIEYDIECQCCDGHGHRGEYERMLSDVPEIKYMREMIYNLHQSVKHILKAHGHDIDKE